MKENMWMLKSVMDQKFTIFWLLICIYSLLHNSIGSLSFGQRDSDWLIDAGTLK